MLSCPDAARTTFKRQRAGWPTLKDGNADKRKLRENSSHAAEVRGTHTTLLLCVFAVSANPQKSPPYAPISVPIWRPKAVTCGQHTYVFCLETSYFNSLAPRLISPNLTSGEG